MCSHYRWDHDKMLFISSSHITYCIMLHHARVTWFRVHSKMLSHSWGGRRFHNSVEDVNNDMWSSCCSCWEWWSVRHFVLWLYVLTVNSCIQFWRTLSISCAPDTAGVYSGCIVYNLYCVGYFMSCQLYFTDYLSRILNWSLIKK